MGSKDRKSLAPLVDANSGMFSLSPPGSVNWPRTLRLAEFSFRDGIQRAVVTTTQSCADVLQRRLAHLRTLLTEHRIPLQVTAAVELTLQNDLFEQVVHTSTLFAGPLRRYVFLRVPSETPLPITPIVAVLRRMNLTTILLAPERCARFQNDPLELKRIASTGGLIQLSAASLSDQSDRTRVRLCRHLIRQRLCHCVATESGRHHDMPISLSDAHRTIARWAGREVADNVCRHNPSRVFAGQPIEVVPAKPRILRNFSRAA